MDETHITEAVRQAIQDGAEASAAGALAAVSDHQEDLRGFRQRLGAAWGEAFRYFDAAYLLALDAGDTFRAAYLEHASATSDYMYEAYVRLHPRACLVASEMGVLLRTGHASGAHSRWRTMHETAVVMLFIQQYGQEVAERYLLHEYTQAQKAAHAHLRVADRLNEPPLADPQINEMDATREQLEDRFGADYSESYGWANEAIGHARVNFARLEDNIDLDHLRPYYGMASLAVHPSSRGVSWNLGGDINTVRLAGPSDAGLADPLDAGMISLAQSTAVLVTHGTSVEDDPLDPEQRITGLVAVQAMHVLQEAMRSVIDRVNGEPED